MLMEAVLPRVAVFLSAMLTFAPWIGAQEGAPSPGVPPPEGRETDWGSDVKECPRCGSTGRIICPTCKGQGSLRKACPICGGKGRRPCPQCAVLDPGSARTQITLGKVPCPACGGKGVTESAPDRPCLRCKGLRVETCLLCFGSGTLSCPKTRYDKTCPTCGYVGRVPCPDCQGSKDGETRSPEAKKGSGTGNDLPAQAGETGADSSSEERPAVGSVRREKVYSEASYQADEKAASTLWEELKKECDESRKILKGDSGSEIKKLRGELTQLSRSVSEGVGGDGAETAQFAQRIKETRGQIEALDRSWGNLQEHFERVEKLKERLQAKWDELPKWTPKFQTPEREAIREHLSRMQSMLTIARKYSATLKEENPERIATGVKEATASVEDLRRDLGKAKTTAQSKKQSKKAVLKSGAAADDLTSHRSAGLPVTQEPRQEAGRRNPPAAESPDVRPPVEGGEGETIVPAGEKKARDPDGRGESPVKARGDGRSRPSGAGGDRPSPGTGDEGDGLAITLGMLGVALCGAIYLILHRREGRPPSPSDRRKSD